MGTLIGWLGTVLGALGVLLALTMAPTPWAGQHHTVYIVLWAVAILCLVIMAGLPVCYGYQWASFRLWVWRAAKAFDRTGPVGVPVSTWPMLPTGGREFTFYTDRQPKKVVWALTRPAGLRITKPFEVSVWESSLPFRVQRHGKTIFRVVEFLPRGYVSGVLSGFVIADQAPGITVSGELSYSEYAPPPHEDSQTPEASKSPDAENMDEAATDGSSSDPG